MASELIGEFGIKGRTFLREDRTGRFAAEAQAGGRAAVAELVETFVALIKASISAHTRTRSEPVSSSTSFQSGS